MASDSDSELFKCCICSESDSVGLDVHAMIQCQHCRVHVHRDCYGYPLLYYPSFDAWTCDSCKSVQEVPICVLCEKGPDMGPLKRTTDWKWAHIVCALWIPEVFFRIPEGREPLDYFQIKEKRFNSTCIYCREIGGACIQCTDSNCGSFFHVTCGVKNHVYLEYKSNPKGQDVIVSYCNVHASKKWKKKKGNKMRE